MMEQLISAQCAGIGRNEFLYKLWAHYTSKAIDNVILLFLIFPSTLMFNNNNFSINLDLVFILKNFFFFIKNHHCMKNLIECMFIVNTIKILQRPKNKKFK